MFSQPKSLQPLKFQFGHFLSKKEQIIPIFSQNFTTVVGMCFKKKIKHSIFGPSSGGHFWSIWPPCPHPIGQLMSHPTQPRWTAHSTTYLCVFWIQWVQKTLRGLYVRNILKIGGKFLHLENLYKMACSRLTSVRRVMFVNKADIFKYIFAAKGVTAGSNDQLRRPRSVFRWDLRDWW